jgi:very-short-patch-repair endonuclease
MKNRRLIHNVTQLKGRRRELRRNSTRAEQLLWTCLRNGRLDGKKFRRQHSIGPYIVDFYCPECRVIVELDGAFHTSLLAAERDSLRSEFLRKFGVEILRFENEDVFKNREGVVEAIRAVLRRRA